MEYVLYSFYIEYVAGSIQYIVDTYYLVCIFKCIVQYIRV